MKTLPLQNTSYRYLETSFKEWLDILGYAPTTVYNLPLHIRELLYWLEQNGCNTIKQLDNLHIQQYYRELQRRANIKRGGGLSNAHLNKHQQALYKFAEYLRKSGKLQLPDLQLRREHKNTKDIEPLTIEEIKELFAATKGYNLGTPLEPFNARDRAMLTIFYCCGLRRNEGYHLDITDINFDRQILHVRKGKGNKQRFVPFSKTSSKHLQDYIYDARPQILKQQTESALFISQRGKRMHSQSMALRLKILQQRTENTALQEKELTLHGLRHSIATHLLQNGMELQKIQRFLGHDSLESTQIYTHLLQSPKERIQKKQRKYKNIPKRQVQKLHEDEQAMPAND